ncbi:MAG: AAA family ATPase [Planctomycetes bacterium]|nr:AAA family ATPase [Planctomycetota bacterium]
MRFNSVKMVGFKKFINSTIEFGPGLTVLHGPNESGKSTLHQAVVTGLYGISRKADTNLIRYKEDARSWQNLPECMIEIDYSVDDARYLIRRNVAAGKVELYNVDDNGERSLVSGNREEIEKTIAEQTGIEDPYVFNRTVSVCQTDLAQASDLGRIGSNVEAIFAGAAAVTASDAAQFIDKSMRKPLRKIKNESPGRLDRLTDRLESLMTEIGKARQEDRRRDELAERIEDLERRLPARKSRLEELTQLIDKGEAKRNIIEELEDARRRFAGVEERIRGIDDCARKLDELQQDMCDLGAITLFDPDQLDGARDELERARAELEARATACGDRIQGMQKRMKAAEELSGEIALIQQEIGELGKLASEEDIDTIDSRRRELAEKLRADDEEVQQQKDRLERIEHSLWGLQQFADKYPDLGDAWQLQSRWQRLELRKDEHKRALEHAMAALQQHEDHRPPSSFGNLFIEMPLPLGFVGLLLAALLISDPYLSIPLAAVALGVAVWWTVWKTRRRSRREQWRGDHARLQGELSQAETRWSEISTEISEFTARIAVPEGEVSTFITEYRSNQDDLKSLRREHEQCVKDRDHAIATHDECEKESRRLAEGFGCTDLPELRDKITRLRTLRQEVEKLSQRLAGVLGLDKVSEPHEMLMSAREIVAELADNKKRIEKKQMELAHRETEFLHRASCDDILQLAERTRKLRAILANKDKLTATMAAHAGGRTLEELKTEQNSQTIEIKVAMAKLEEDFAGFDATVEQTEFWRKEKDRLENEIPELAESLTAASTELFLLEENACTPPAELEGEKEFIESEIERGDLVVTACRLAVNALREIEDEHHNTYVPRLQKDAGEYFGRLTHGAYQAVDLEEKWPSGLVAVDNTGRQVECEKLSRGTIDQLYFSVRLALANALSGKTALPLILDDPFVNFDSARFEEAIATIISLVQEGRQIIYFTHSPRLAQRQEEWQRQEVDVLCVQLGQ